MSKEEKPKSVEDVVLFMGNLAELREFTGQDWRISSSDPFFINEEYPRFEDLICSRIRDSGYNGLIHFTICGGEYAGAYNYWSCYGIPVVRGKKQ